MAPLPDGCELPIAAAFPPSGVFCLAWAPYVTGTRCSPLTDELDFMFAVAEYLGHKPPDTSILFRLREHFSCEQMLPLVQELWKALASSEAMMATFRTAATYLHERGVTRLSLIGRFYEDAAQAADLMSFEQESYIWVHAYVCMCEFIKAHACYTDNKWLPPSKNSLADVMWKTVAAEKGSVMGDVASLDPYLLRCMRPPSAQKRSWPDYKDLTVGEQELHRLCDTGTVLESEHGADGDIEDEDAEEGDSSGSEGAPKEPERPKYQYPAQLSRLFAKQGLVPGSFLALNESFTGARRSLASRENMRRKVKPRESHQPWFATSRGFRTAKLVFYLMAQKFDFRSCDAIPPALDVDLGLLTQYAIANSESRVPSEFSVEANMLRLQYMLPRADFAELERLWRLLLDDYELVSQSPSMLATFHFLSAKLWGGNGSNLSARMHLDFATNEAEKISKEFVFNDKTDCMAYPDLDLRWRIVLTKYFDLNLCFDALVDILDAAHNGQWSDEMQQTQSIILADLFLNLDEIVLADMLVKQVRESQSCLHEQLLEQVRIMQIKVLMQRQYFSSAFGLAREFAVECNSRGETNQMLQYNAFAMRALVAQNRYFEALEWLEDFEDHCHLQQQQCLLLESMILQLKVHLELGSVENAQSLRAIIDRHIESAPLRQQGEYFFLSQRQRAADSERAPDSAQLTMALYFENNLTLLGGIDGTRHQLGSSGACQNMLALLKDTFRGAKSLDKVDAGAFECEFEAAYGEYVEELTSSGSATIDTKPSRNVYLQPPPAASVDMHALNGTSTPLDHMDNSMLQNKRLRPSTGSPRRMHVKKRSL